MGAIGGHPHAVPHIAGALAREAADDAHRLAGRIAADTVLEQRRQARCQQVQIVIERMS